MRTHRLPSDDEVRARIEAIERPHYRLAFMYQYLIAGRISEVCGRYAPLGADAFEVKFNGESAILFVVKTAKRRGRLRPVALPLDPKYEAWTRPVFDYFRECGEDYPFRFADKWSTSIRYMQWQAEAAFRGLEWPMIEYTKSVDVEFDPQEVLDERINERNKEVYKVRLPDGSTSNWLTKVAENTVRLSEKIDGRWKNATSHVLRKRRTRTLVFDYLFDEIDLSLYGGWTESSQAEKMPQAIKHYLYVDIQSARENVKLLTRLARRYFPKLLIPVGGTPI